MKPSPVLGSLSVFTLIWLSVHILLVIGRLVLIEYLDAFMRFQGLAVCVQKVAAVFLYPYQLIPVQVFPSAYKGRCNGISLCSAITPLLLIMRLYCAHSGFIGMMTSHLLRVVP